jgi:hypothetical protein
MRRSEAAVAREGHDNAGWYRGAHASSLHRGEAFRMSGGWR